MKLVKYSSMGLILILLFALFYVKIHTPKFTFELMTPTVGKLEVSIRGIGNVGALDIYSITAQTGGKILTITKESGEWVKKNELLIVMDGVDLPKQLEVATSTLRQTKFELKATKNDLKNQKAQRALLNTTYKRYKKLKEQAFISISEYDKAKVDLQRIDATLMNISAKIASGKEAVVIARKNIELIEEKIKRLKVYAPVDGYIISKEADVAQNVLPSTPILKIVDPKTLWVATKIDERISSQIQTLQKASITLRSEPHKSYPAMVKKISTMSDAVTLEREVYVAFEVIPKPFYIHEQAEVEIIVKTYENVLKLPLEILVQEKGEIGIWISKNNHAHFLKIEKIAQSDDEIAISNIKKDMQIIMPNINNITLKEGMRINP
jgi:RND family efflux transporter MFP subunit